MSAHYLPPGVKPEHIDAIIKNIVDFLPDLARAKAIDLPGANEVEQALQRSYDTLQLMKQHYVPNQTQIGE